MVKLQYFKFLCLLTLSLIYYSNTPFFLSIYRRNNPRMMLGENEKPLTSLAGELFSCSPKILSSFFNNDNRTEWSSILSVITSMITNRIVLHKVLLSVNHNHNNFRKKRINLGQTSPLEKFYSCCCL